MPPSCQRFSSGGSLGKLVLPKALIFLAFRESPRNSVHLFTLRLHALCCCWLRLTGSSWRDTAPPWRPRTCGPWGKRTHRTKSSLNCRMSGQPNVQRSKSKTTLLCFPNIEDHETISSPNSWYAKMLCSCWITHDKTSLYPGPFAPDWSCFYASDVVPQ